MKIRNAFALALAAQLVLTAVVAKERSAPGTPVFVGGVEVLSGYVNVVEGTAALVRGGLLYALAPKLRLEAGDEVVVDAGSRAEVLLTPGYFLRLGERSDVRVVDLSPTNQKLALVAGTIGVEIAEVDPFTVPTGCDMEGLYELVTVATTHGNAVLETGGLYRVDAAATTSVRVAKGTADLAGTTVEHDRRASSDGVTTTVERAAGDVDEFDRWVRERSKSAVEANRALALPTYAGRPYTRLSVADPTSSNDVVGRQTISATGDVLRFADPGVETRRGDADWTAAAADASFAPGDRLRTGPASRAVVTLFPNCRLFVSWGSEVAYVANERDHATVEVVRGSAEVFVAVNEPLVTLEAKGRRVDQRLSGTYRVDVGRDGRAEARVRRGRAAVGATTLGGGDRLSLDEPDARPRSLDGERDGFDVWCRQQCVGIDERAKLVAYMRRHRARLCGVWYEPPTGAAAFLFMPTGWRYRSGDGDRYPKNY